MGARESVSVRLEGLWLGLMHAFFLYARYGHERRGSTSLLTSILADVLALKQSQVVESVFDIKYNPK